jgi:hypothetical protein
MDVVEISDARIDLARVFEGTVEGLEFSGRAHLIDGVIQSGDGRKGSIDGNGVRRQADAAQVGELLELGSGRR